MRLSRVTGQVLTYSRKNTKKGKTDFGAAQVVESQTQQGQGHSRNLSLMDSTSIGEKGEKGASDLCVLN